MSDNPYPSNDRTGVKSTPSPRKSILKKTRSRTSSNGGASQAVASGLDLTNTELARSQCAYAKQSRDLITAQARETEEILIEANRRREFGMSIPLELVEPREANPALVPSYPQPLRPEGTDRNEPRYLAGLVMDALKTRFLQAPAVMRANCRDMGPEEILVKIAYVSPNRQDAEQAAKRLTWHSILGSEFSGYVIAIGKDVDSSFKEYDRIAGIVRGCQFKYGAFADYVVVNPNMCINVPEHMDLGDGCTIALGWICAAQALRKHLFHPRWRKGNGDVRDDKPGGSQDTLLIYSAATNTGIYALQQARIDHPQLFIIALASPQHHARLLGLGANKVFDYHSLSLVKDIQALDRDIRHAIDCWSRGYSTSITASCMLPKSHSNDANRLAASRRIVRTLPLKYSKGRIASGVQANEYVSLRKIHNEVYDPFFWIGVLFLVAETVFQAIGIWPRRSEHSWDFLKVDHVNAVTALKRLQAQLKAGKVVANNPRTFDGGLAQICGGLDEIREGRVRGEKLVYQVGGRRRRVSFDERTKTLSIIG